MIRGFRVKALIVPKVLRVETSLEGSAKVGVFSVLKISQRKISFTRSLRGVVLITAMCPRGFDVPIATNANLAARTKNLEIDYSAVSLNRASRVRFRYKLENVDAGWRDAGSRRQAFYNNLPPGKYQFVVSASNGDNLWNEAGATMNMEVPPTFLTRPPGFVHSACWRQCWVFGASCDYASDRL
jgi:hypothetical protein